jgi:hypothetical protein
MEGKVHAIPTHDLALRVCVKETAAAVGLDGGDDAEVRWGGLRWDTRGSRLTGLRPAQQS